MISSGLYTQAFGIYHYLKRRERTPDLCLLKYNNAGVQVKQTSAPLSLKKLSVPFCVLLVGYSLAFLVFLVELAAHRRRRG